MHNLPIYSHGFGMREGYDSENEKVNNGCSHCGKSDCTGCEKSEDRNGVLHSLEKLVLNTFFPNRNNV